MIGIEVYVTTLTEYDALESYLLLFNADLDDTAGIQDQLQAQLLGYEVF